ncbi:MAG: GH42, partial [uncultured Thermomicrobiales bacterium]
GHPPRPPRRLYPRSLLLPRTLAPRPLARLRPPHARARPHLRPDRRVRLEPDGAASRGVGLGLARRRDRNPRRGEPEGRPLYPDRHATGLADSRPPRDPAGRRRGANPKLRLPQALRPRQPRLPGAFQPDHGGDRGPLRRAPGRRRLADGQRVRLPLHDPLLRSRLPRRLPRLAGGAVRDDGGVERSLGQRFLEPGVRRLLRDRPAQPDRHRSEPLPRPRLRPLRQRHRRHVPGGAGRDPAAALAGALGDPQLHDALRRVRPLPCRRMPRLRHLGLLPAGPGRTIRHVRGGEAALGANRSAGPDLLQPRPLPGPLRWGKPWLLGDGAGRRTGQLGAFQSPAGPRRGRPLDRPGPGPRRRRRLLLPVARRHGRPGTDALRAAPPRRDARPRRRGGRGAGDRRLAKRAGPRPGRPPPRLREPLGLRRTAPQRRRRLLGSAHALLFGAARPRRRRRCPTPGARHNRISPRRRPRPPAGGGGACSPPDGAGADDAARRRSAHRLPDADRPRPRGRAARPAARAAGPLHAELRRSAARPHRPRRRPRGRHLGGKLRAPRRRGDPHLRQWSPRRRTGGRPSRSRDDDRRLEPDADHRGLHRPPGRGGRADDAPPGRRPRRPPRRHGDLAQLQRDAGHAAGRVDPRPRLVRAAADL